jgi:hypothetical protein
MGQPTLLILGSNLRNHRCTPGRWTIVDTHRLTAIMDTHYFKHAILVSWEIMGVDNFRQVGNDGCP